MRASQLHKLNTHGENSAGEVAVTLKSLDQHGSDTLEATIEVSGFGNIGDVLNATTDIGAGNVAHSYTVLAARESVGVMATGLAADITADAGHTASAVGSLVRITKTTAGTLEVVSTSVT